jgi:CheY-like chemotaxis protein
MSRTILLADDSLTIQKVVELTFADTEYEVVAVSSGDDLLQRLPETRPDLVICDVIMPGKDGYEVCQEIKSNSEFLHLPVILLTGTFEPFDRDRAIAVGCSEIITKPFEAKKLVDAVERLAAAPAAPPPQAAETQEIGPDELTASDADEALDDTDVSQEYGPAEVAEAESGEEAAVQMEDVGDDLPPVDSPEEYQPDEFDLDDEASAVEWDSPDLPEIEKPPSTVEFSDFAPDPAQTLAAAEIDAMMQTEEVEAVSFEDEAAAVDEPFVDAVEAAGPFSPSGNTAEADQAIEADVDSSKTTPIDVSAVMVDHQPYLEAKAEFELDDEPGEAAVDDADTQDFDDEPGEDAMDDADTQDFGDKPPIDEVPEEASLSDADIDRIARRVLELATDRIDNIAWDVIPDMAEVVVRERVREIEAEAEAEAERESS